MSAARITARRTRDRFCSTPGCSVRLTRCELARCVWCVRGGARISAAILLAVSRERRASR